MRFIQSYQVIEILLRNMCFYLQTLLLTKDDKLFLYVNITYMEIPKRMEFVLMSLNDKILGLTICACSVSNATLSYDSNS